MPLYRVIHQHIGNRSAFVNTVSADSTEDAIARREYDLRLEPADRADYDVTTEPIADPDGSLERRWIERWGL